MFSRKSYEVQIYWFILVSVLFVLTSSSNPNKSAAMFAVKGAVLSEQKQ